MIGTTLRALLKISGTGGAGEAEYRNASSAAACIGSVSRPTGMDAVPPSHEAGINDTPANPQASGAVGLPHEKVGRLEPTNGKASGILSHPPHLSHAQATVPIQSFWERVALVRQDHEYFINHLMRCSRCYAPKDRYCPEGERRQELLRKAWEAN